MIDFVDMQLLHPTRNVTPTAYDAVFFGTPIDERGRRSHAVAIASAGRGFSVAYLPDQYQLRVANEQARVSDLSSLERTIPGTSVLLDATSLNAVELLLLTRMFLNCPAPRRVGFLYAEPKAYVKKNPDHADTPFAFARHVAGEHPVPGFAHELRSDEPARLVACLGFESDRLNRILGDDDHYFIRHRHLIFGVPPYRTSWEMHALLPHAEQLSESNVEIAYAGASNPRATYRKLGQIADTISPHYPGRLVLAPIGSTPSSIGMALYACCREDVRIKYDFPTRAEGLTLGVGPLHHYAAERRASA